MALTVALATVYATVATYSLSFMAQVPLLPYILQQLGASSAAYGSLQTFFSLAQLVGGLLAGPLVDRYGARSLLLISLWSSVISYALAASAQSTAALYLSRLPTIMQHAILAARALVAANTPAQQRAKLMGYLGTAHGVGFALGPALGGVLSSASASLRTTAWAAAACSVLSALAVHWLVPVEHQKQSSQATQPPSSAAVQQQASDDDGAVEHNGQRESPAGAQAGNSVKKKQTSLLQSLRVLQYPGVRQVMAVKVFTGLAGALLQSVFSLMLQKHYGLSSQYNGMVLSYVGLLNLLSQAVLVEPTRRYLGEGRAVYVSCVVLGVSYLGLAASRPCDLPGLLVVLAAATVGGSIMTTICTAQLTQAAPHDVLGSVLALDMSLFSGARLFTPAIGTMLLTRGGSKAVGLSAASLIGTLLLAIHAGWIRCSVDAHDTTMKVQVAKLSDGTTCNGTDQTVDGKRKAD